MQVTSTTQTAAAATSSDKATSSSKTATIDYNNFLQILIAEMKYQDPTQPSDPAQYISQLSSFSSVEQQLNTNSKLDNLMTMMALNQAGSVIGRTVTSADGSVSGQVASVQIISGGSVATLNDGRQLALGAGVTIT